MNYIKQYKKVKNKKIRKRLISKFRDSDQRMRLYAKDEANNKLSFAIGTGFSWNASYDEWVYWVKIYKLANKQKLELRKGKKYKRIKK